MEEVNQNQPVVDGDDEHADQFVARVCEAMDRGRLRVWVRMQVPEGEDPDVVFGPIAKRLVRQCGVLSIHIVSARPLVYEVGPRAIDVWGPAVEEAIGAHDDGCALVVDPLSIYQRTAEKWRNLLRARPLSMTDKESHLLSEVIGQVAAEHGLSALPTNDGKVWLSGAGV